jgi:hypothetical protein
MRSLLHKESCSSPSRVSRTRERGRGVRASRLMRGPYIIATPMNGIHAWRTSPSISHMTRAEESRGDGDVKRGAGVSSRENPSVAKRPGQATTRDMFAAIGERGAMGYLDTRRLRRHHRWPGMPSLEQTWDICADGCGEALMIRHEPWASTQATSSPSPTCTAATPTHDGKP